MKYRIILIPLFILFLLGSCITPKETNLLQDIEKNYSMDDVAPVDYKIIPGDQLVLIVYTLDESMRSLFSMFVEDKIVSPTRTPISQIGGGIEGDPSLPKNVLTVSTKGFINVPYIGEIYVLDMTILEAKKVIGEKFMNYSPNVTVDVSLRNRYFFVLGEMGARSIRMNNLRITIFQALAQSGTMTDYANRKEIKIIRQTSSGTEVKTFDIRSQDILNSDFYYIQPNDVIYAQQMQRKFFGRISSFTEIFGFITGSVGLILGVINITK